MIRRTQDWQLRLAQFLAARRTTPFAWGHNDCATFAADCVLAITGTDPAPPALRNHRTAKQALRALRRHGGLVGIATAALGPPVPPAQANVGDVLLLKSGHHDALAICNGVTAMAPSAHGLVSVGLHSARHCWRVA